MKALHSALVIRGHDVTRTPNAWIAREASDTAQLLGATAQGRVLFAFNHIRYWPGRRRRSYGRKGLAGGCWPLTGDAQAVHGALSP
jgi:hypothetical protein